MSDLLTQLMADYDDAKDDHAFTPPHPIFALCEHVDKLRITIEMLESENHALRKHIKCHALSPVGD